MKSKIGIVICGVDNQKQHVSDSYVQAIHHANGLPIILPLVKSKPSIQEFVSLCDGFLFCGGDDVTPLLFGQEPELGLGKTDIALDLFQIRLMKTVLESAKPVLAICRGMQILNIACGGTVYQNLHNLDFEPINHMQTSISRKDISHKVFFSEKSKLNQLLGSFAYTNSFHHQAVDKLGNGLIATGHTGDDIIEAIEMPSHTYVIGVQWHPECMTETPSHMKLLFHALIHHSK